MVSKKVFENFIIGEGATCLEALQKINKNRKGFLIILRCNIVVGTLTDGDLRRAFISGKTINDSINDIYKKDCMYIYKSNFFKDAVEGFKNSAVKFLPIVDENKELINVITKRQLHCLLLQNQKFSYDYDFLSIDESIIDYEIYQRPWGFYKTTILNKFFQSKVICINPNSSLSFQLHRRREEHWIIVHGEGKVLLEDSIKSVVGGDYLFIPKGCKHQIENVSKSENLILTEVQLGDYFGEDDIIRFADKYGRVIDK